MLKRISWVFVAIRISWRLASVFTNRMGLFVSLVRVLVLNKLRGMQPTGVKLGLMTVIVRDAADVSALYEVFVEKEYDVDIPPPARIVDLGAHIGSASLYFSHKYPNADIDSYEPDRRNVRLLEQNVLGHASVHEKAVAVGRGSIEFYEASSTTGSSAQALRSGGAIVKRTYTVKCESFDSILAKRPDLVKFDVEGIEYEIFSKTPNLERCPAYVGEVHPSLMGHSVEKFLDLFPDSYTKTARPLEGGRAIVSCVMR